MNRLPSFLVLGTVTAFNAMAQGPPPGAPRPAMMIGDSAVHISEHVWVIRGEPNIGIVVGTRATLVVDTGLGERNGATAAAIAAKLAPGNRLFLTTTHFHPEHSTGESGFPSGTVLIRNDVQQEQMETSLAAMSKMFSDRAPADAALLKDNVTRTPDVTFHDRATVDLGGGVTAQLLWFGEAHTKGDELTLVSPDATLISGDVVQNKTIPGIYGDGGTPTTWLAVLDQAAKLHVEHVVPDHSDPGDGSLVAAERDLIVAIRTRALALKAQGVPVDEAGKRISAELKAQHPDWARTNAGMFVQNVYQDPSTP